MLPKKKRVTKEQFLTIMKQGGTLSVPLFMFRYIPQKTPQYAFVAPKTIAKSAVDRNRMRRQGYNALIGQTLKPCVGIFFYKKEAQKASPKDIKDNVAMVFSKIKPL
jgi:ribonuclease P protein component